MIALVLFLVGCFGLQAAIAIVTGAVARRVALTRGGLAGLWTLGLASIAAVALGGDGLVIHPDASIDPVFALCLLGTLLGGHAAMRDGLRPGARLVLRS